MRDFVKALVVVALVGTSSFGAISFKLGAGSLTVQNVLIMPGETITVNLYAQGSTASIKAVGGDIVATGPAGVLESQGAFVWQPTSTVAGAFGERIPNTTTGFAGVADKPYYTDFDPDTGDPLAWDNTYTALLAGDDAVMGTADDLNVQNGYVIGAPKAWQAVIGANGGAAQLGSGQPDLISPNSNFAKTSFAKLGSYTVKGIAPGVVNLNWVEAPLVNGTSVGYGGWYTVSLTKDDKAIGTLTGLTINVGVPEPATMALLALGGLLIARRRRG